MKEKKIFGLHIVQDMSFYQKVLAIVIPVAGQQAINMGVNMMDTMMLGQMGEVQLSASSLANQYYMLFNIFCMGIIGGCSVLVSQYWGAGKKDMVKETFSMSMRLTLILSAFFTILTIFFPRQIMACFTSEPDVIEKGVLYLQITVFIFAIHGLGLVFASLMRAVGQAKLGLVVSIISFFVNIVANYVFIFGKFGAPRMEIAGAALGTLIARISEFIVTFVYILFMDKSLGLRIKDLLKNPSGSFYKNYFKLGAPVLISDALLGFGGTMVSVVLGHMGAAVVAANSICMVLDRLLTVIITGVASASSIIVGQTIGSGKREEALHQGETFYFLSVAFGIICALAVMVFGPMTISIYAIDETTVRITKELMLAYVVITFFQSVQSVMTKGVLRGGGDTKFLMKADVLFLWLVSVPLGALGAFLLHWPAWLVMLALRADFVIKSAWCVSRLMSGKWIKRIDA